MRRKVGSININGKVGIRACGIINLTLAPQTGLKQVNVNVKVVIIRGSVCVLGGGGELARFGWVRGG